MPKRTLQFLPIRLVLALLCFLVLVGCDEPTTRRERVDDVRDGKLYINGHDKGYFTAKYRYIPPASTADPGTPGHWDAIVSTTPVTPQPTPQDAYGNYPPGQTVGIEDGGASTRRGGGRRSGANRRAVRAATSTATSGSATVVYILDEYGVIQIRSGPRYVRRDTGFQ